MSLDTCPKSSTPAGLKVVHDKEANLSSVDGLNHRLFFSGQRDERAVSNLSVSVSWIGIRPGRPRRSRVGPQATQALNSALCIDEREEPVLVQALVAKSAIERLDEGVVHRFPRAAELERHAMLMRPDIERLAPELRAVVHRDMRCGRPRVRCRRSSTATTRTPPRLTSTSMTGHSHVQASISVSARKARPSAHVSRAKSIAQCSFGCVAPATSTRATATRFRRGVARPALRADRAAARACDCPGPRLPKFPGQYRRAPAGFASASSRRRTRSATSSRCSGT